MREAGAVSGGWRPTEEQGAAVGILDRNLIVVAGAGSGKTRVLVERYLRLLEANPDWSIKSLVAITFTRAAAYEMRHRLRQGLEERAESGGESRWLGHLLEMDSARIDTIHGLCAALLRANAAEAGIDPQFEVLDEVEAAILLEDVVEDVIHGLDAELMTLFEYYDANMILDAMRDASLVSLDMPKDIPSGEDLLERWRAEWAEAALSARDRLLESGEIRRLLNGEDYPPGDKLGALHLQYQDYLLRMAEESEAEEVLRLMRECHVKGAVGGKGSAKVWGGAEGKKAAAAELRVARDMIKAQLDGIGEPLGELDELSARMLPLWMGLLDEARGAYGRKKEEQALLDFDDLEGMAALVLGDDAVRRRYRDEEFKHILVDEFQDTNAAQWQIIQGLADLGRGGTVFAVGDPKQSIYQFRGADVSVFNRVRQRLAADAYGQELSLSTTFRAHRRLVEQFNSLFERILTVDENSPVADYQVRLDSPMRAFREESPQDVPSIACLLLDGHARDDDGEYLRSGKKRKMTIPSDEMRRWEAYEIARRVKGMIAGRRLVYDRDGGGPRPMRYGDITILFQSMRPVNIYESCFKAAEIPFLTVAGRGYFDRQEVWDMLDLLRCLHNPGDNLSLASALRSPMFGFSDDLLFALRLMKDNGRPLTLWRAMEAAREEGGPGLRDGDTALLDWALETLDFLRSLSGRVSISELLRRALERTGYLAILTGLPDGARRRGNVEKLVELAEASGKITLGKFSRYLADLVTREIREGEALMEAGDAVRIMTVHASKGLEFPMVILADASWTLGNRGSALLLNDAEYGLSCRVFDSEASKYAGGFAHRRNAALLAQREAAEKKRLLYVAATRAQDYLFVSGRVSFGKEGTMTSRGWLGQLIEAFEMEDIGQKEEQSHSFAGDRIRVMMPGTVPPADVLYAGGEWRAHAWEESVVDGHGSPWMPELIAPIPVEKAASLGHISATRLEAVGADLHSDGPEREAYGRGVFGGEWGENRARSLGSLMHKLLGYGLYEAGEEEIRSFAWQEGLVGGSRVDAVVDEAGWLLADFRRSEVYGWIESARANQRPVYRELPFVYRSGGWVIHGVLDLLLQREDGSWVVVDYKTAAYQGERRDYHLQVAVYAAAVRERMGLSELPETHLHYLVGNRVVKVEREDCLAELARLEDVVGELGLGDG